MRVTLLRRLDPWAPPLLLMAVIFLLSAQPHLTSGLGFADLIGRKLVHVGEYALLAFLWWRAIAPRVGRRRAALLAFLVTSAYAATDEYHQAFVTDRHATPVDWLIDSAGAGAVSLRLAGRRTRRRTPA